MLAVQHIESHARDMFRLFVSVHRDQAIEQWGRTAKA